MLSCRLIKHSSVSGRKNSLIACRQVPQGGTGLTVAVTTTIFLKDISPAAIAENKATRSAQHVTGYAALDRKSTRLNSSHVAISYAVFRLRKKIVGKNIPPARVQDL